MEIEEIHEGWSHTYCEDTTHLSLSQESKVLSLTRLMHKKLHQTCPYSPAPRALFYHFSLPHGEALTTSVLVAVVPAVIVSITLPLGGNTGTFAKGAHCTGEVAPTTSTLGAAG